PLVPDHVAFEITGVAHRFGRRAGIHDRRQGRHGVLLVVVHATGPASRHPRGRRRVEGPLAPGPEGPTLMPMPDLMKAWVVDRPGPVGGRPLVQVEKAVPE